MLDKERSLDEAQKRAELLINENAEAEARRRVEDEAQRRARDEEQAERLAAALARADKAEAMLSNMEAKMEMMMKAMLAGAPHSSTVAGMYSFLLTSAMFLAVYCIPPTQVAHTMQNREAQKKGETWALPQWTYMQRQLRIAVCSLSQKVV